MEHKHAKAYNNILKLLPKASVNFQNPLYSPSRDKRSDHHHMNRHKTHMSKGFSGSLTSSMSLVPIEARRNSKNNDQSVANQEPTSPKISCMGQIKHKHKKKFDKAKSFSVAKEEDNNNNNNNNSKAFSPKKRVPILKRMFTMTSKPARKCSHQVVDRDEKPPPPETAPCLSHMKRFASGRETFASFDWTAHQVAPETDRGIYYSYDEDEDEDEFIIPFSAPIAVVKGVALKPKKEVNLWKRRTTNPPTPLQLNSIGG